MAQTNVQIHKGSLLSPSRHLAIDDPVFVDGLTQIGATGGFDLTPPTIRQWIKLFGEER